VNAGEVAVVNATVENVGDLDGTQTLTFAVNGTTEATRTVTLNASESTTEQFGYTTSSADVPSVSLAVASNDDTATATTAVNGVPVANGDSYATPANTTLSVSAQGVLANDTDPDGDTLSATVVSGPSDGTLALAADGSFEYTPDPGFTGTDSFTYAAGDGDASDTATVSVTVNRPPDLAVAVTGTNSPVLDGGTVLVDTTVENVGGVTANQTVTVSIGGSTVDTVSVSVAPGDTQSLTLAWNLSDDHTGNYTATVATDDDATTTTITVDCIETRNQSRDDPPDAVCDSRREDGRSDDGDGNDDRDEGRGDDSGGNGDNRDEERDRASKLAEPPTGTPTRP
jgi:hypothetical protein